MSKQHGRPTSILIMEWRRVPIFLVDRSGLISVPRTGAGDNGDSFSEQSLSLRW